VFLSLNLNACVPFSAVSILISPSSTCNDDTGFDVPIPILGVFAPEAVMNKDSPFCFVRNL
jgi:hypothetical protein